MPDAITASFDDTSTTPRYFQLGPIPPKSFLLSLYGVAYASTNGYLELAHALTLEDTADIVAHAAGRRLQARGTLVYNTQPGYLIGTPAHVAPGWTIPLNRWVPGGSAWIITRVRQGTALTTWNIVLTVTWLAECEHDLLYGAYRPVTVVGAPQPGVPPVPGAGQHLPSPGVVPV